jgi:transcriptional regulator with XRE-family HTH domain
MRDFRCAKRHIEALPGELIRILRELQEISQNELTEICGILQSIKSAIRNDRIKIG